MIHYHQVQPGKQFIFEMPNIQLQKENNGVDYDGKDLNHLSQAESRCIPKRESYI
jgi:hypothetical protein